MNEILGQIDTPNTPEVADFGCPGGPESGPSPLRRRKDDIVHLSEWVWGGVPHLEELCVLTWTSEAREAAGVLREAAEGLQDHLRVLEFAQ